MNTCRWTCRGIYYFFSSVVRISWYHFWLLSTCIPSMLAIYTLFYACLLESAQECCFAQARSSFYFAPKTSKRYQCPDNVDSKIDKRSTGLVHVVSKTNKNHSDDSHKRSRAYLFIIIGREEKIELVALSVRIMLTRWRPSVALTANEQKGCVNRLR